MLQSDPLSFLDEYAEPKDSTGGGADPLSFLDVSEESEKPSFRKRKSYEPDEAETSDALAFLEEQEPQESFLDKFKTKPFTSEKTSPEKSLRQNVLETYRPEEKIPEQLKSMSLEERMQYAEDLKNLRELQSGTGFAKGALSGLTLSASEHIPGLKPDEDDLMVGLGETVGSFLPISKLYNFIGKPLVSFAAKSPVAKQGLMALARMTGFGVTGATYKAGKELVQGEVPEPKELLKEGATWAGIDAVLQSLGLGVAFSQSIERIAEQEGITVKEVLNKLWDSTKNYAKLKFGRSIKGEILPEDVELLVERAKAAEAEGLAPEVEIAAEEVKKPEVAAEHKPEMEVTEPEVKGEIVIPENAVLNKPENISIGMRGGNGVASVPVRKIGEEDKEYFEHETVPVTEEEQDLIDASNAWDKAGDHKESSELADKARQMIFNRLKGQKQPKEEPQTFETSKGSIYHMHEDGSTTRTKAARAEHPGEEGLQPKSEKTWFVTPEDSVKLGEFQTKGEDKKIVELPNGQLGVQYQSGKDKGKIESRTLVDFSKEPKEGYIPVESWNDGEKVHFGNQIVKIEKQKAAAPKPEEMKWEYTREDFPTKEDAQAYLEHLERSLAKAPESHKPNLERDIKNLEELVSGFEKEEAGKAQPVEKVEGPQLSLSESVDQIKSFPGTPNKPSTLNSDDILAATPREKHFLVKDALDAIESIRGRKAGEINFDKFFELQKQLIKYIETPELESFKFANENTIKAHKAELKRRETALEAKTKVFKNSLKKSEGTVKGEPVLKSKTEEELAKKPTQVPPKQTRPLQPVMGQKQAVARSKIIDLFRKAFTDPIRLGKISQKKAAGIHKLWPKVTRLLKDNDIETVAHEIGHNLHTTLYGGDAKTPQDQAKNIEAALKPYLDELKPLAHYEPWGMEGFAEFTRLYVTNPNVAKELAPNFYDKFEADLEAQYPEMKNASA